jgi:hypothetical protein
MYTCDAQAGAESAKEATGKEREHKKNMKKLVGDMQFNAFDCNLKRSNPSFSSAASNPTVRLKASCSTQPSA